VILLGAIALGFPLLAGCFGSAVMGRLTLLDRAERFAASWGVSFAFVGFCQFASFALHANQLAFGLVALGFVLGLVAATYLLSTHRASSRRTALPSGLDGSGEPSSDSSVSAKLIIGQVDPQSADGDFRFLVLACGLAYLHLLCIQALLPNYRGSSWYYDWCMHYEEALVFVGDRPIDDTWANGYTLASRTPMFNLTTAFIMALAGHDFAVFQTASVLTNIAFVSAVYLLLRDLFGKRAGRLALLLAPLNLWMLHDAWYTWPKMLAAYFVLLALHFYIQSVRLRATDPRKASQAFLYFGISGVLGFMTHQVSLVYILPLLLHAAVLAWKDRVARPRLAELAALALAIALLVLPWYGWLAATLGTDAIAHSTPATLGDERARFRPLDAVGWMSFNTAFSVIPAGLIGPFFTDWPADIGIPNDLDELRRGLRHVRLRVPDPLDLYWGATELYFSLLTGALTVSLLAFLGWRAWRRGCERSPVDSRPLADRRIRWATWLFLGLGTAGAAFLHPGKIWWGIAHSAAFPTAIVLVALGWGVLSRANPRVGLLVCIGMVIEFLAMFWSHWWFLTHRPEVLEALPGNEEYKEKGIAFLNDRLGDWALLFVACTIAVQGILVLLLLRYWRTPQQSETPGTA
jgi:hypothetical protein